MPLTNRPGNMDLPVPKDLELTIFFEKLYDFLNDPSLDSILRWKGSGASFCVGNNYLFEQTLCPKFYQHCTWLNFIKILNACGFRKDGEVENIEGNDIEFSHLNFIKHDLENLTREERQELFRTGLGEKTSVNTAYKSPINAQTQLKKLQEEIEVWKSGTSELTQKLGYLVDEYELVARKLAQLKRTKSQKYKP